MTDYKCGACGASFPSEEALRSHAKMKFADESIHYRKMSAHGQIEPIYPDQKEKPR